MTGFDAGIALFVVLGALFGLAAGAFSQFVGLAAWAAGMAAPYFFAEPVGRALVGPLELPFAVTYTFAGIALSILAWVGVRIAISVLFRPKKNPDEASIGSLVDRVLGALMGAAKASVVVWALASVMVVVTEPLEARGVSMPWASGHVLSLAKKHNLFSMLFHERIERMRVALERAKKKASGEAGAMAGLLDDTRLRKLLSDAEAKAALESGDIAGVLKSNELASLLSDHGAIAKIEAALAGE